MIDLHMHTTYSDGSKTVEEILKICEEKKLECISITDHNTCKAYYEDIIKNNKIFKGKIIIGCELNVQFQNRVVEILAYNINPDIIMEWKKNYYTEEKRIKDEKEICDRFLKILDKKGIKYNIENIKISENENVFVEKIICLEIYKYEENKKIIGNDIYREFYRKELTNPDSEYFLNRAKTYPNAQEIIELIHKAGGKAFLAHPYEYKIQDTMQYIEDLKNNTDIDGIECFHPSANEKQIEILQNYAKSNNLYMCGGSDYHGKLKPDIEIGIGKGNLKIPKNIIKDWL